MFLLSILLFLIPITLTAQQKVENTSPRAILTFVCPYPLPMMQRPASVELDTDSDVSEAEEPVHNAPGTTSTLEILQSAQNRKK